MLHFSVLLKNLSLIVKIFKNDKTIKKYKKGNEEIEYKSSDDKIYKNNEMLFKIDKEADNYKKL